MKRWSTVMEPDLTIYCADNIQKEYVKKKDNTLILKAPNQFRVEPECFVWIDLNVFAYWGNGREDLILQENRYLEVGMVGSIWIGGRIQILLMNFGHKEIYVPFKQTILECQIGNIKIQKPKKINFEILDDALIHQRLYHDHLRILRIRARDEWSKEFQLEPSATLGEFIVPNAREILQHFIDVSSPVRFMEPLESSSSTIEDNADNPDKTRDLSEEEIPMIQKGSKTKSIIPANINQFKDDIYVRNETIFTGIKEIKGSQQVVMYEREIPHPDLSVRRESIELSEEIQKMSTQPMDWSPWEPKLRSKSPPKERPVSDDETYRMISYLNNQEKMGNSVKSTLSQVQYISPIKTTVRKTKTTMPKIEKDVRMEKIKEEPDE